MLGMRRTLFVVPVELAPVMHEACTKALIPGQRARLLRLLEEQGVTPRGRGEAWLARVGAATLAAIAARGEATARELTAEVPELRAKLTIGEGKTWAGTMGVSTRVLFLLATEGSIVRTRPLGAWTSGQYRWATTEHWLGAPLAEIDHAQACSELLGRWLRSFGPAMMTDIRWWTGWTAAQAKTTLVAVDAVAVQMGDDTAYALPDDLDPVGDVDPWVALLPGLDPTTMGWKDRGWYLGDHAAELFDRTGNAGPTVWANGRAVGAWGQTEEGDVAVELFGRLDAATRKRLDAERERLAAWLGDVRIRPRFATALGKELAARSGARAGAH
jgi:winged helix DNA-binding protein